MIKGKPLFGLVAVAGVIVSTGVAYAAVAMTSNSTAQPASAPQAAVDLANIAANPAASVFLEADISTRGGMTKSGETAGDPPGKAVVILRISRNQIMYEITVQGMSSPSAVRVREGAAVDLSLVSKSMSGSINAVLGVINVRSTSAVVNRLVTDPGRFDATLVSGGAMQGRFRKIGPVDFNRILHVGTLTSVDSGDQEVQKAGDPNGHATVFVGGMRTTVNYAAIWNGVQSPTALNVNKGAIGAVGGLAVSLFKAPHGLDPTIIAVAGTVRDVPIKTVTAMNARPAAFHTNLTSGAFPQGAVRGQLFAPTTTMTPPTTTMKPTTTVMPTTTKTMPTMTMPTMPTKTTTMQKPPVKPTVSLPTTPGPITHW